MNNTDVNKTRQAELHLYDGLAEIPCSGENFLISGAAGPLEAVLVQPESFVAGDPIAVVCHPHPLHGGSMANKVVHIISNTLNHMALTTLRFNFRGVGHSMGCFDNGVGEVQDLLAVAAWLARRYPSSPVWLAGFSFGAFVVFSCYEAVGAARLLLVAPPVAKFSFPEIATPVTIPWMVIQGGKDDVVSPQEVSIWVQRQPNPPHFEWFADADHFFHGQLNRIKDVIKNQWDYAVE
ncbi:MAG: alpha/beta hydrolase [Gammaproteobacteria bacterium]|nr:alpha/beta hydrolase [Gammaproteobacteria bacterium]